MTSRFDVAGFKNTLTAGLELSKEQSNVSRFTNGLDDIAPTPLLDPDPFNTPPTPLTPYSNPKGRGSDVSVYALDSIALGPHWDVDAGTALGSVRLELQRGLYGHRVFAHRHLRESARRGDLQAR